MRQKNQVRALVVLGIVTFLALSSTAAYFVTTRTAHNIISTSGVDIELDELADPEGSIPFDDLENISPGVTYSKIPYVENVDIESVWVRVKLILKKKVGESETTIDDLTSLMELGEMGNAWLDGGDGFFYYNLSLASGQKTEPIFKTVKLKNEAGDEYKDAVFAFTISAEATQVANNGISAQEASWTESGGE